MPSFKFLGLIMKKSAKSILVVPFLDEFRTAVPVCVCSQSWFHTNMYVYTWAREVILVNSSRSIKVDQRQFKSILVDSK